MLISDPNPVHGASIEQLVNSETAKASVGGMSNEVKTKALAAPVNERYLSWPEYTFKHIFFSIKHNFFLHFLNNEHT